MNKNFEIKVYTPSREYIADWKNADFQRFRKTVNGGLGRCKIVLDKEFSYEGGDLALNNEVRILVSDEDDINKLIYSGYISEYSPEIKEGKEKITVTLLGYYTKLAQDVWKDGTDTIHDYSGSATDVGTVFRTLMDRYIAETDSPRMFYTNKSLETTSSTIEYTFKRMTYREGIDTLSSLAPLGWWWFVGADGQMQFHDKLSSATHSFIEGRHFSDIKVSRSMEKLKNTVLFLAIQYDGVNDLYRMYRDYFSVNKYGRRIKLIKNDEIGAVSDAEKIADKYIDDHKDPAVRVEVVVADNTISTGGEGIAEGYNIESIEPGDTCCFQGLAGSMADLLHGNMMISEIEYRCNSAKIIVEPLGTGVVKRATRLDERITRKDRADISNDYDTP